MNKYIDNKISFTVLYHIFNYYTKIKCFLIKCDDNIVLLYCFIYEKILPRNICINLHRYHSNYLDFHSKL